MAFLGTEVYTAQIPFGEFKELVGSDNRVDFIIKLPLYELFCEIEDFNEIVDEYIPMEVFGIGDISYKIVGHDNDNNVLIQVNAEVDWMEEGEIE